MTLPHIDPEDIDRRAIYTRIVELEDELDHAILEYNTTKKYKTTKKKIDDIKLLIEINKALYYGTAIEQ